MRKRIDRFIEDVLTEFGDWFIAADWIGKERDCVNMFAHGFLSREIKPGAAIHQLTQIRIESASPQPKGYKKLTASKDLVIWKDGLETVWGEKWQVRNYPWVVMEWKIKRKGKPSSRFDAHDVEWLSGFTKDYSGTFGYLVRLYDGVHGRAIDWAKVRQGVIRETNKRS